MTDLELASNLALMKRAVAGPGLFDSDYPGMQVTDVADMLADGFARAQLWGYFPLNTLDPIQRTITPDLSPAGMSLIVAYAAVQVLQFKLLAAQQSTTYKAGSVEASSSSAATVLTALLNRAQNEIDFLWAKVSSRVMPAFGDLEAVRLYGKFGQGLETTEIPRFNTQWGVLGGWV